MIRDDKHSLLLRAAGSGMTEDMNAAKGLLTKEGTDRLSARVFTVPVSRALALWRTRLAISTDLTHRTIFGARDLIARLESMDPSADLEQYAFAGPESAGSLFFSPGTDDFVGLVAVDSHGNTGTDESLLALLRGR